VLIRKVKTEAHITTENSFIVQAPEVEYVNFLANVEEAKIE
jgi:hypothetical protein